MLQLLLLLLLLLLVTVIPLILARCQLASTASSPSIIR